MENLEIQKFERKIGNATLVVAEHVRFLGCNQVMQRSKAIGNYLKIIKSVLNTNYYHKHFMM